MLQNLADPSRREFLTLSGMSAIAAIIASRCTFAEPADVEAQFKKLFGSKAMTEGKIRLDIPPIAENGFFVPINIEVESPMTPDNYVRTLHVFSDGNPFPNVFSYRFTPESGRAAGSNRIRLAKTQHIIAVAEMSDGTLHVAKSEVKVTIGGCGG